MARFSTLLMALLFACEEAPSESPNAPPPSEERTSAAAPPNEAPPIETTTGFIAATIDGEAARFSHLLAHENRALSRATEVKAYESAQSRRSLQLLWMNTDVRTLDFPATFGRGTGNARDVQAAMRMTSINYEDGQGHSYVRIVQAGDLECQSLEESVLKCTFSGELTGRGDAPGPLSLTDGQLEVRLTQDVMIDAASEIVGQPADRAGAQAQEAINSAR